MAQLFKLNSKEDGTTTSTTLRIARGMGAATEAIAILILLIGATYFAKQQSGLMKGIILSRGWDVMTMGIVSFLVSSTVNFGVQLDRRLSDTSLQLFSIILGLLAAASNW